MNHLNPDAPPAGGETRKRKRGLRRSKQKARMALLQKPYSQLTWDERLEIEDVQRRHAAFLQRREQQQAGGNGGGRAKRSEPAGDPPTPRNTTEHIIGSHAAEGEAESSCESDFEGLGEFLDRLAGEREVLERGGEAVLQTALAHERASGGGGGGGGGGAAAPPPALTKLSGGGSAAAALRKQRTGSLDFLAEPFDEAAALRLSAEELVAALKRTRDNCRRLLERAQAAEAEVAALRAGSSPATGGCHAAALRGEA